MEAPRLMTPEAAVTLAERKLSERHATFEHYELAREALRFSNATVTPRAVESAIQHRLEAGQLVAIHHYRDQAPGARYTTRETLTIERQTIERMLAGQNAVRPISRNANLSGYPQLEDNPARQQILSDFLSTRDQIVALNGIAGSAKSSGAAILKELAEKQGFRVQGLAPTRSATRELADKGISSETLQKHLMRRRESAEQPAQKTLYILDESSLASTKNVRDFFRTLQPQDHVILVGDDAPDRRKVGQHTSVEAGRVFQLLQEAGMKTAHFNKIYRQATPELKEVVLQFRHGNPAKAIELLDRQGRVHEHDHRRDRFEAIGKAYAAAPEGTLVVSPDNQSRREINSAIREKLRERGSLASQDQHVQILLPRDATTIDTSRASSYHLGDVIQYRRGNREVGVQAGAYATVLSRDTDENRITVKRQDGEAVTYNPARATGVSMYESRVESFAQGDRIQFTASMKQLGVNHRDLGTIRSLDDHGNATVEVANKRMVRFNLQANPHLDHGYTLTSHISQSKTADRVLIHADASDPRTRHLVNQVFGYVSDSRSRRDVEWYTTSKQELVNALSRGNEEKTALSPEQAMAYQQQRKAPAAGIERKSPPQERQHSYGIGIGR